MIARNSAFTFKGKAVDIKQVGREFGVRYVLEGSVAEVRQPYPDNGPVDRCGYWRTSVGRTDMTEHLRTSLSCRTR